MASATSTKETTNYARLCRLLVDVGSQALRDTFDRIHSAAGLHTLLARHPVHLALQSLRKKKILNPTQWGKLYPTIPSSVSSAGFDITLLMVLLRNICGLRPPLTGWDSLPSAADVSMEANIARVKYFRNTVYGHASQASVDDATFNTHWQDISNALVRLGGASYVAIVNKLKNECMDHDTEEHYKALLTQWKKDEDSIKDKLEEMEGNIKDKLEQVENQVKKLSEKVDNLTEPNETSRDEELLKQWKEDKGNIEDKLGEVEENIKDKLEQVENQVKKLSEKMDNLTEPNETSRDEGDFDPAELIDDIRQLYKLREGWLTPFPWCEEFHFRLDDIFTRLKMVSRKKTRGTATADIVNMSDIFKPHQESSQPRTVLIEGEPGMGKTTCCKKLVYDWATRKQEVEDCFPQFETVLLLKCRDITESADLWEAIDDQLLPRDVEEDVRESFFNFIRHNQSKVLLVLDGLDEVPDSKLPMLSEIIQGRVLPKCHLVVTARHEAGIKVRIHCDTLLEIEGFTEEDARTFIMKYFKTREDLALKLLYKLGHDSNLKEMAANPLNTALLCLLCEEFQGVFPENKTKLYLEMIQCVLSRYITKKGSLEDSKDLIEVYKTQLKHLGWIALNGLLEDNLDFEESELGNHKSDLPGFGFLSLQPGGSKLRPRRRYAFLHKSFQEIFAAFYLCCQLLNKEISPDSLAADRRYLHQLKEVLLFTCGMLAAQNEEIAVALIKSITEQVNGQGDVKVGGDWSTVALECIKECKKDNNNFGIKLAGVFGSFLELQTLDYRSKICDADVVVLADALKCNTSLTVLNLSFNTIGDRGAAALAAALKCNATLTVLDLPHNNIGDPGAAALAAALKCNKALTKLHLVSNNIGASGAAALAAALKCNTTLTGLCLLGNNIGDPGAAALADAVKCNATLTMLYPGEKIGDPGVAALADALKCNTTLTLLCLSYNNIGDLGAAALAAALKCNSTLTVLQLYNNNIGDPGAAALAAALKCNNSLTSLWLFRNNIGAPGAAALADALKCTTLKKVLLSDNKIGAAGAAALADAIKYNTTLTVLYLSNNNIGDPGAAALADAIKYNTTLSELHLLSNNIGAPGAAALADALKCNATLTLLYLSNNNIGDPGAAALADALQYNTTLAEVELLSNNIGDPGAAALADERLNCLITY